MFTIRVLAVGRLRAAWRAPADEYLRRLRRRARVEEREVREAGKAGNPVAARREEGRRLLEAVPAGTRVVALARAGTAWSSAQLAARLGRWRDTTSGVTLVIGGADGLDPSVLTEAHDVWSLGPLTLPHELARVLVLEQLYRGFTILSGELYHKGGPA